MEHIKELTRKVEERSGTQVLSVVARRSDSYPEALWKAFSLGAVFGMLLPRAMLPLPIAAAIPGLLFALAAHFFPPFARLFVSGERAAEETKQFASSLFLERGLHRTPSRKAILVLFAQFERRAALVADSAINAAVPAADLDRIAASMARKTAAEAFAAGLPALEQLLIRSGFSATGAGDEVPEEFLEMEGPKP